MPRQPRLRRWVLFGMLGSTAWLGATLLAWQKYGWPARFLAVPVALAPFAVILLWVRRHPT